MSQKKIILNLLPLLDYFENKIDPLLGIFNYTNTPAIRQELISTEVMLLMGVEYKPYMNCLRVLLNENMATDIKNHLLTGFNAIAYQILSDESIDQMNLHCAKISPLPGYMLQISEITPTDQIKFNLHTGELCPIQIRA